MKQLNNSECIPFAFRIYATYEVEERLTDLKLHALIDQLNPNLRSIDEVDGKKRVREFYAMSKEQAYSILETIAILGGCKDRLHLYEPTTEEKKSENLAQEIEEEHIERLSPFAFSKCKIPVGATITFVHQGNVNSGAQCTVVDDKTVEYQGRRSSLSALATELTESKWGVAGPRYFKYNGVWLNELRAKEEGWKVTSRLDGTVPAERVFDLIDMSYMATASAKKKEKIRPPKEWIIPANPKYYDIPTLRCI